jgi:hypothetical protein
MFRCEVCGGVVEEKNLTCPSCQTHYTPIYRQEETIAVTKARIMTIALGSALGSALLGAIMAGQFPLPKEETARRKAIGELTTSFVTSGFVGLIVGLIATR